MFKFIFITTVILAALFAITKGSDTEQQYEYCVTNKYCANNEMCKQNRCVDACDGTRATAARNAVCVSTNHTAFWNCPAGYRGSPSTRCLKDCIIHSECAWMDVCKDKECIPGCDTIQCERNQNCFTFDNTPRCI